MASMCVTLVFRCFDLSLLTTTTAACQPATTTTTTTTTRPKNNRECWRWGKETEMGGPSRYGFSLINHTSCTNHYLQITKDGLSPPCHFKNTPQRFWHGKDGALPCHVKTHSTWQGETTPSCHVNNDVARRDCPSLWPCHIEILNVFDEEGTAPSPHHIENPTWTTASRILVECVLCPSSLQEHTHVWLSSMPQWCLIYQINYITYIFTELKVFHAKAVAWAKARPGLSWAGWQGSADKFLKPKPV